MLLTYRYRVKGKKARRLLKDYGRAVNHVWNYCVETQKKAQSAWRLGSARVWPSCYDLTALTRGASKELRVHAQTIENVCAQFVASRDAQRRCPSFRASTGPRRSLGWVPIREQSRQITTSSVTYLGHTYRFFGAKRRPLPASAKGGGFAEDAQGRWWVYLHVVVTPDHECGLGSVALDLGLHVLAATSDGKVIDNIRSSRRWEKKLAVAQRARRKGRVKAIHSKIANARKDHLHKASHGLVREYQEIIVGNVNAGQLARTRFGKSVLDAGWSTFRSMLRYKASRHGAIYREVDERFTTQTCSSCGGLPPGRPEGIAGLGMREWECSLCGAHHDRDVNAARNILRLGLSVQPPAEESLCSSTG